MKLEVGMYVRTPRGFIRKITRIGISSATGVQYFYINYNGSDLGFPIKDAKKDGFKIEHDIIDLIEVGDFVNGFRVESVYNPTGNEVLWIKLSCNPIDNWENEDIKSVVTKEQFESMAYKVVEE